MLNLLNHGEKCTVPKYQVSLADCVRPLHSLWIGLILVITSEPLKSIL